MSVPVSQMWTVATYVLGQRLRGRKRYPLVLMLSTTVHLATALVLWSVSQRPAEGLGLEKQQA